MMATRWIALAIFFLAGMLSYTDRFILNFLVDPIRGAMAISDTQVSYLQGAAFAVLYAFFGLPLGRYADRHNRRRLLVAGIVLWSAATAACGLARDFIELFVARILVGIGEAALAPAVMSMIPDLFPPQRRGLAISIFLTGLTAGSGMASLVGGLLLDLFQRDACALPFACGLAPWRSVLVTMAVPGAVLSALLLLLVREPARRSDAAAAASDGDPRFFWRERRLFVPLFAGLAIWQMAEYGFNAWLPALLSRNFDLGAVQLGSMIGAAGIIGSIGGNLAGGLLADRLQQRGKPAARITALCIVSLLAPFTLLAPLLPTPYAILPVYTLFVALTSAAFSTGIAAIQDVVPNRLRGLAVSIQAFLYTIIGLGLGPSLVALATDHLWRDPARVGWSIVTVAIPAVLVASLLLSRARRPYRDLVEG